MCASDPPCCSKTLFRANTNTWLRMGYKQQANNSWNKVIFDFITLRYNSDGRIEMWNRRSIRAHSIVGRNNICLSIDFNERVTPLD